ncbi:DUF5957 family protein [Halobacillus naozhouensis]|uniref:DUF5957 family protein n=1 Tax=Halobacillus naozhouensis TaxID=554880 RepID=A0ABY8J228_9BACI|nr:DUF5957 family protein [Halobacillus naozhouensis]WFT75443.1 DUF5957 family protein [Halobacillus naozhouensis]
MRKAMVIIVAALAGIVTGIVVSELIGMISYLWFGKLMGIKYLPIVFAIVFAWIGPGIDRRFIRTNTRK